MKVSYISAHYLKVHLYLNHVLCLAYVNIKDQVSHDDSEYYIILALRIMIIYQIIMVITNTYAAQTYCDITAVQWYVWVLYATSLGVVQ